MPNAYITFVYSLQSLPQCRLNRCSSSVRYGFNLGIDFFFILCQCGLHHPAKSIVKGNHPHIIRTSHLIYSRFSRSYGKIQIRGAAACDCTHTSGMIDHHNHRHGRCFIHPPQFHVNREHCLQYTFPVSPQCVALLPTAADQSAAVLFYICLNIGQKSIGKIR